MIIAHKRDIIAHIATAPEVLEGKAAYENDDEWRDVERELVKCVQRAGHPPYGQDWSTWFKDNLGELLGEAISIVM